MLEALVGETAQGVIRAVVLAGIMLVVGVCAAALRIAPLFDGDPVRAELVAARTRHVARVAVLLLTVGVAWRLVQQAAAFAESPGQWPTTVSLVLTRTTWGTGWFVQAAGLALALAAAPLACRAERRRWLPLGAAALLLSVSPALGGHAVGAPRLVALAVTFDALHVLGAGAWLGTLLVLAVAVFPVAATHPPADSGGLTAVLDRFSPLALGSGGVVAFTGAFASWLHLERLDAVWSTPYGRTLLLKLAILSGVAAVGAYNWRVVTPRIRASGGSAALRRSALVELLLSAALVAVTAVLVATPLPAEM